MKLFQSAPKDCKDCPLSASRTQVVYPDVLENSKDNLSIMIIGEAPGAFEDKSGKPFVGHSGKILRNKLKTLPGTIIISNTVKCRPPSNRDPHVAEKNSCYPFLKQEIEYYNPQLFILVGRHATSSLLGSKVIVNFSSISGSIFNEKYIPIIHPAATLYNSKKNKPIWELSWQNIYDKIKEILPDAIFIEEKSTQINSRNLQDWLH